MVYACNWCQFRAMPAAFFLPYKVKTLREESAIAMSTGKNIKFVRLVFGSDFQSWSNWTLECWFLRSTKWNASLILLRDYGELVSLCKVIIWKTHIPVRTQKWPPRLIFAGACHGIVFNYGHG